MPVTLRKRKRPDQRVSPPTNIEDSNTISTAGLDVQLLEMSGAVLPYIDTAEGDETRRYFLGRPGQQFAVRAD